MKPNLKSLFVKAALLALPLSYVPFAQAAADRMGGVVYNSNSGDAIQFGIISSYDNSHKSVLEAVTNKVGPAVAASSIKSTFSSVAVSGYKTCDGFYNYIKAGKTNNGILMFNNLPSAPPTTLLTDPASWTTWVKSTYGSFRGVYNPNDNPCNWIGNGEIWMMLKVPAPYANTMMTDANRADLVVPANDATKYTIIAFKLGEVKLPW